MQTSNMQALPLTNAHKSANVAYLTKHPKDQNASLSLLLIFLSFLNSSDVMSSSHHLIYILFFYLSLFFHYLTSRFLFLGFLPVLWLLLCRKIGNYGFFFFSL